MRRLLLSSGVNGRPKSLEWLQHAVEARQPEGILFAGGVLDRTRHYAPQTATPWGLTGEDARFIEHFLETLGKLKLFSAVIPGPADTPLEDFLRMGMHAEVDFPGLHLVHASLLEYGDLAVSGLGGPLCPGPALEVDTCSRTLAAYYLRPLLASKKPHRILLMANPAAGPLGGEKGNSLVSDLVDSIHPALCVAPGPSERRGFQRVASTLLVNPGFLAEGWAAFLDWNQPPGDQVEFLDLRHLKLSHVASDIGAGD